MADGTGIEWTDATWNPIRGCSRVSEGCRNCYAEKVAVRFSGTGLPYEGLTREGKWNGSVRVVESALEQPLRWARPRKIFVNSMSDLFHENVSNETIAAIFGVMASAPHHTFQVLTKRPQRMREWFKWIEQTLPSRHPLGEVRGVRWYAWNVPALEDKIKPSYSGRPDWPSWPLPNVWLGVSVENQAAADARIPILLETPAAMRFLSCEPLLGEVDLEHLQWPGKHKVDVLRGGAWEFGGIPGFTNHSDMATIDWVIVGGESGPGARPMRAEWARYLRNQCAAAAVPFFFKQWGEHVEVEQMTEDCAHDVDMAVNLAGNPQTVFRVGKKRAGSLLDEVQHKAFPEVKP